MIFETLCSKLSNKANSGTCGWPDWFQSKSSLLSSLIMFAYSTIHTITVCFCFFNGNLILESNALLWFLVTLVNWSLGVATLCYSFVQFILQLQLHSSNWALGCSSVQCNATFDINTENTEISKIIGRTVHRKKKQNQLRINSYSINMNLLL